MPVFIFIIILIAGIIMLARSVLFWLYFIQLKNYHYSRLLHEFRQKSFYRLIFSTHRIILIFLVIIFILLRVDEIRGQIRDPDYEPFAILFIFGVLPFLIYFTLYAASSTKRFLTRTLCVPRFTAKITVLFVAILLSESIIGYRINPLLFKSIPTIQAIEILQPFIVLGIFAIVFLPNIFLHRYFINRAKIKIQAHKNLIVIGITGSYGKTSTKEFLAHILSKKFQVLKTPAHINVDTGVAKVILKQLRKEHEIFIVEMGAYRKGEIRKICNLVKPQYAILAGLSDQHLELFGSLKAITEAKFEIIETITDQNKIIANADSKPLVIEFERRKLKPVWYGLSARAQIKAHYVGFAEQGALFKINNIQFQTALIGHSALNNLLGAITMAHSLGMSIEEIAEAVGDLHFVPHTMEPRLLANGALIIDDTYNANTEGVLSALEDLQYYNRTKKILVFKEVIELGEKTESDHLQIAKTIARTTACVVLLPSRVRQIMYNALIAEGYNSERIIDPRDYARLKDIINGDTVVLFEGRGGEEIIDKLT